MHLRVYLPPTGEAYARLFFVVGVGATLGDPKHEAVLFKVLAAHGLAVIAHDHYAHGFSGDVASMHAVSVYRELLVVLGSYADGSAFVASNVD